MRFIDTFWDTEEITCSQSNSSNKISFYFYDMPVDEDTFCAIYDPFWDGLGVKEVDWHEYSEQAVTQWLIDNPVAPKSLSVLHEDTAVEKQAYMDSLAYLHAPE